jgi:hypothetical protein
VKPPAGREEAWPRYDYTGFDQQLVLGQDEAGKPTATLILSAKETP